MANFFATSQPIDLGADDDHDPPGDHDRDRDRRSRSSCASCSPGPASASRCAPRSTTARSRSLNGARPDRVSMLAWAIGTSLAALGGILIAPGVALDAASLSLLIVSAYAAAIFGRLRSLPLTFLGAIVVGCTEGYLSGLPARRTSTSAGSGSRSRRSSCSSCCSCCPNPRLRGRMTRSREFFPTPTIQGALGFAAAVIAIGVVLATTLERPGPDHLRQGLLDRDRRALARAARRLRRPDLAVPAQLRRHRRGRDGPHRCWRRSARPSCGPC